MKIRDTNIKQAIIPNVKKLGRPKKWQTVEELEDQVQGYFNSCFIPLREEVKKVIKTETEVETTYEKKDLIDRQGNIVYEQIKPFTVTGLAVHLDTCRDTLLDYEKKPENAAFSDTIKRAKNIIHQYAEEYLYDGKNQTGAIFNLKNNWQWADRTELDLTSKNKQINHTVVDAKVNDILKDD